MKRLTSVGLRRARSRETGWGLQDLVRAPQLVALAAQPADLLALLAGRQVGPQPLVGLGLAHLLAQRLGMDPEVVSDVRDRPLSLQAIRTTRWIS
jgi:hypothetical protein